MPPEATWTDLPFDEAIQFFKQKLPLPTTAWDQIINEAQDFAFTVADITRAQMLTDIQQAITKALEQGTTLEEFIRDFDETAARLGWQPPAGKEKLWGGWRMELIFMQNLRGAYAAGRYQQMSDPEVLSTRPYWMWRHRDSRVPRPAHLALDGKVFPADSVFWQTCFPPGGWGCRCQAMSLSQRDVQRRGLTVESPPNQQVTLQDRITGNQIRVPAVDGEPVAEPGFVHAPGSAPRQRRKDVLDRAIDRLPPALRRQIRKRDR